MDNLLFKRGDFICMADNPQIYAIFDGGVYEEKDGNGELYFSLIAYYCPMEYNDGIKDILSYNLEIEDLRCDYTISESTLKYWRKCSEYEKEDIIFDLRYDWKLSYDTFSDTFYRCSGKEEEFTKVFEFDDYKDTEWDKEKKDEAVKITIPTEWKQIRDICGNTAKHEELIKNECLNYKETFSYSSSYRNYNFYDDDYYGSFYSKYDKYYE